LVYVLALVGFMDVGMQGEGEEREKMYLLIIQKNLHCHGVKPIGFMRLFA